MSVSLSANQVMLHGAREQLPSGLLEEIEDVVCKADSLTDCLLQRPVADVGPAFNLLLKLLLVDSVTMISLVLINEVVEPAHVEVMTRMPCPDVNPPVQSFRGRGAELHLLEVMAKGRGITLNLTTLV